MGEIKFPEPVKFFVGLITNEIALIKKIEAMLTKRFGPIDLQSDIIDFDFTTYYNKEMGVNLKRKFLSFKKLVSLENIRTAKILTNKVEKSLCRKGKRRINIDPGYICLNKLVLLTTKDFYHRIYLGKGIYAEATLHYKDKTFQPFEWSYPDYRSMLYIEFFNKVREGYFYQLRQARC